MAVVARARAAEAVEMVAVVRAMEGTATAVVAKTEVQKAVGRARRTAVWGVGWKAVLRMREMVVAMATQTVVEQEVAPTRVAVSRSAPWAIVRCPLRRLPQAPASAQASRSRHLMTQTGTRSSHLLSSIRSPYRTSRRLQTAQTAAGEACQLRAPRCPQTRQADQQSAATHQSSPQAQPSWTAQRLHCRRSMPKGRAKVMLQWRVVGKETGKEVGRAISKVEVLREPPREAAVMVM